MKGTSLPATAPMRLMPPMMTDPTIIARMIPVTIVGIEPFEAFSVTMPTFQAWNMFPPVMAETSRVMQKMPPMTLPTVPNPRSLSPLLMTHIGPPCGLSGSSVLR